MNPMKLTHWEFLKGRFIVRAACAGFAFAMFSATMFAGGASAQNTVTGVPNAMQGFSQNRDQPIQIEAASLEMRDKKKEATFTGNVKVVQGDTTMTSKVLVVFYEFIEPECRAGNSGRQCQDRCQICACSIRADAIRNAGSGRRVVDQTARGQGQCGRDPKGSSGDRRQRRVRYQDQPHHDAGWWGTRCDDPRQERSARR